MDNIPDNAGKIAPAQKNSNWYKSKRGRANILLKQHPLKKGSRSRYGLLQNAPLVTTIHTVNETLEHDRLQFAQVNSFFMR